MGKWIHIIVNPAAGKPEPILNTLNTIFRAAGVRWDVSITHESGEAHRYALEAAKAGADVVAAYGGDGTVMEAAMALRDAQTPLAILPGGTANLMAVELGIPKNLAKAAEIACSETSQIRQVDMGQLGTDKYFILRVGVGFAARKVAYADRQLKDRFGILAYSIAALKALKDTNKAHYKLILDGKQVEVEGLTCLVENAGNMGVSWASPTHKISVGDGLLDVVIVRSTAFIAMITSADAYSVQKPDESFFYHWQAREIVIDTTPPQPVQVDGELAGETPITVRVVPNAVRVLVPEE